MYDLVDTDKTYAWDIRTRYQYCDDDQCGDDNSEVFHDGAMKISPKIIGNRIIPCIFES
jgi:hypothetical protein